MTDYLEEPTEDDIHLARWLLGGFVLLQAASALLPDDWDGISFDVFRAQLHQTYQPIIDDWLRNYHIPWLQSRGLPVGIDATPLRIDRFISAAIRDTRDLHRSMQESFSTGTFSQWASPTHQGLILRDLARISGDHLNFSLNTRLQLEGFLTGKQRWRTASPDSRHAELDMHVTTGIWRYKGQNITNPRHNPQDPREWSGCSCYIEYEWQADDGFTGWL
jgi:hypothetical protein